MRDCNDYEKGQVRSYNRKFSDRRDYFTKFNIFKNRNTISQNRESTNKIQDQIVKPKSTKQKVENSQNKDKIVTQKNKIIPPTYAGIVGGNMNKIQDNSIFSQRDMSYTQNCFLSLVPSLGKRPRNSEEEDVEGAVGYTPLKKSQSLVDNNIYNLSSYNLSQSEIKLLSRGLKFAPAVKPNLFTLFIDFNKFTRNVCRQKFFALNLKEDNEINKGIVLNSQDNETLNILRSLDSGNNEDEGTNEELQV